MKTALSHIRETVLYGKNGRGDERIRSEKNRCGYYSFAVVLFILWCSMAAGLLAGNMTLAVFACALFVTGIVSQLYFLVRNGSFTDERVTGKHISMKVLHITVSVTVFAFFQLLFKTHAFTASDTEGTFSLIIWSLTGGIVWTAGIHLLSVLLKKISDNRLERNM